MGNHSTTAFYGPADAQAFINGIQLAVNQIPGDGIYTGDNLFTFGRNLGFLEDDALMKAFNTHATTPQEQSILWRNVVVTWGMRNGLRLEGDFVECGCYKGVTARIAYDAAGLVNHPDRHYYLYDLFEHDVTMAHHALPDHSRTLFTECKSRFADFPNVTVTQGKVPDVLAQVAPERIAFMNLDLNNAEGEIGALEVLFDRMVPGAVLVFDDYGWSAYRQQKLAEDPWLLKRGYRILELPTGQGLLVK